MIVANSQLIVPVNGQWQIMGFQIPHTLYFAAQPEPRPSFAGIPELDEMIMLNLDSKSLLAACSTNEQLYSICQDDRFWREKMRHDHPDLIPYKPEGMSFRNQYLSLSRARDPYRAARTGRLDVLMNMKQQGVDLSQYTHPPLIDVAVRSGRPELLEWLQEEGLSPTPLTAIIAAGVSNGPVLDWFEQQGVHFNHTHLYEAISRGNLETIEWLMNHGLVPTEATIHGLIIAVNLPILDLLMQHGVDVYQEEALKWAMLNKGPEILAWVDQKGLPIPPGIADSALYLGNFVLLDWLFDRGIVPDIGIAIRTLGRNITLEHLRWLDLHGLLTDPEEMLLKNSLNI